MIKHCHLHGLIEHIVMALVAVGVVALAVALAEKALQVPVRHSATFTDLSLAAVIGRVYMFFIY